MESSWFYFMSSKRCNLSYLNSFLCLVVLWSYGLLLLMDSLFLIELVWEGVFSLSNLSVLVCLFDALTSISIDYTIIFIIQSKRSKTAKSPNSFPFNISIRFDQRSFSIILELIQFNIEMIWINIRKNNIYIFESVRDILLVISSFLYSQTKMVLSQNYLIEVLPFLFCSII